MGYAHCWGALKNDLSLDNNTTNLIKAVAFDYDLCFELDKPYEKPIITSTKIRFNGQNENGFETFYFDLKNTNDDHGFCKTGYRPYDLPLCLVLMIIKNCLKDNIVIESDGNNKDWEKAFNKIENYLPNVYFEIENNFLVIK